MIMRTSVITSYYKPHKGSLTGAINACLVITGAFKATSGERLYQELRLEWLKYKRWRRKLCSF